MPRYNVLVNESNAHLASALAGVGMIQTLDFMVRSAMSRGERVSVLDGWQPPVSDIYLAYPPSRKYSSKVRVFIDWIKSIYADIR